MIKVKVESTELVYDSTREIDESRIIQLIKGMRRNNQSVCVLLTIEEYPVDLLLPTGVCSKMGRGASRPLRPQEQRIVDAWKRHKLNKADFNEGELIAFLKQVGRLLNK